MESKGIIKDNTLDILASNDTGQDPKLQNNLEKLDEVPVFGKVVTRFAPSPTGFLHIGGLRTALYNYLFAKKHEGTFILRIEDTDQKRFVSEAENYIKNALKWVGIDPDQSPWKGGPNGPYKQSERDYTKERNYLIDNDLAYYAFDTEDELSAARKINPNFAYDFNSRMKMRNSLSLPKEEVSRLMDEGAPYVIRFKTPPNKDITFNDIIRGTVTFNTKQTDDKVLVKSNGIPTYHMANVCDDHNMGVTHVIRGEEWLPSTPLHILLYQAFKWSPPIFAHLPLLLNPDGKGKLSKRHSLKYGFPVFPMGGEAEDEKGNKVTYKGFKDEGYEPEALINFLVMLGWTPANGKEILDIAEMISEFDLNKVHKSGAKFDIEKAKWFNQQYLQKKSDEELLKDLNIDGPYHYDKEKLSQIIDLAKKRSNFRSDLSQITDIFFRPIKLSASDLSKISPEFKSVFSEFIQRAVKINWDENSIKNLISEICSEKSIKMGKVMPSLRIAITGGVAGPDLITTLSILNRNESISRIRNCL